LLTHRTDYAAAREGFLWPNLGTFNWAIDWFDIIAGANDRPALRVIEEDGTEQTLSFAELSERSTQLANWLRAQGVARGDRLLVMLPNRVELWETILAATKLGAVIIPATTLLDPGDLVDRVERGDVRHVIATAGDTSKFDRVPGEYTRIAVGGAVGGWAAYAEAQTAQGGAFLPDGPTQGSDPLLLYFTSGTTSKPKLVEHTHVSYPVGHLSTMYWIGLQPGDVHLNVSSPGWAKHAWSNVFAPWNAEATVLVYNYDRFVAKALLDQIVRCEVSSFCAPPTVWRMLVQEDLSSWDIKVRELVAAGEPLNPEVIEQVRAAWGITIRDGYGQTETTAQIGNPPGNRVKEGSMGRPLPGYTVALLDPVDGKEGDEGEIAIPLAVRPPALMTGYRDSQEIHDAAMRDGYYHTGDVASRDVDGYITYIGRADDVFKASDYRISPFELESVLIEHPFVAEAAVVPAPDELRLAIPKAYVTLRPGHPPNEETAFSILKHARDHLAPYKRVRRIEFAELPKTISGKIRRVELRRQEEERASASATRAPGEFREEDFPALRP
jgi:acetyl-CoA synthetase